MLTLYLQGTKTALLVTDTIQKKEEETEQILVKMKKEEEEVAAQKQAFPTPRTPILTAPAPTTTTTIMAITVTNLAPTASMWKPVG
jgi:hypothetical protein